MNGVLAPNPAVYLAHDGRPAPIVLERPPEPALGVEIAETLSARLRRIDPVKMNREDLVSALLLLAAEASDAMDRRIVFVALESLKTFLTAGSDDKSSGAAIDQALERLKKMGFA